MREIIPLLILSFVSGIFIGLCPLLDYMFKWKIFHNELDEPRAILHWLASVVSGVLVGTPSCITFLYFLQKK